MAADAYVNSIYRAQVFRESQHWQQRHEQQQQQYNYRTDITAIAAKVPSK